MTVDNEINGSLLKLKRESLGWTLADMAARACLSTKQVRQLEEGGDNSFYSHAIKLTVAKKIAQILQISEDELFFRAPNAVGEQGAENVDHPIEMDLEHLVSTEAHSLSENLTKLSDSEAKHATSSSQTSTTSSVEITSTPKSSASTPSPVSASKKDADQPVSFASILTRSQSSSDDLDALLAEEESSPSADPSLAHEHLEHPKEAGTATVVVAQAALPSSSPTSISESSHTETVGLPSTPSPITLSSASSSLSEDQHPQEQSIWVKVILAVLVLIGALLIVAPKTFDDLAEKIEGGFKKAETPLESSPNSTSTAPMTVPALDASQSDTPVEPSKSTPNSQEPTKPMSAASPSAPVSPSTAATPATTASSATSPTSPVAPSQQNLTSIPTTAVPSANQSLGNTTSSANQRQANNPAVNNQAPAAPGTSGQ